jgi:hypothetical protein
MGSAEMAASPRYFVILATMRSGSNHLERTLAAAPDVLAAGELFNPAFVGGPGRNERFGIGRAARDRDPLAMLAALREAAGPRIAGFRLFPGHDTRVLDHVLADPDCARVVLRRSPLDSYLSLQIASVQDVWQVSALRPLPDRSRIAFDAIGFARHVEEQQAFYDSIRTGLARHGHPALWVAYPDLLEAATLAGIARFIGAREAPQQRPLATLRKQNPQPAVTKVSNPLDLVRSVQMLDREALFSRPDFEVARRIVAPEAMIARRAGLLYLPLPGTDRDRIATWLGAHEAQCAGAEAPADLIEPTGIRPILRWLRRVPGHQRFSVVAHPLARAHAVFRDSVVAPAGSRFARLRTVLAADFGVVLPEAWPAPEFDAAAYRTALLGFLRFVAANHARQTMVHVNARWASQAALLAGLPSEVAPHHVFRTDQLIAAAGYLETARGLEPCPLPAAAAEPAPGLSEVYDAELERAARRALARDYTAFGFGPWTAGSA